MDQPPLRQLQR